MTSVSKAQIIAAIQRAGRELGRAPSRGELKRLTGVSHYRVLTQFRSLREAVRAAGLEPSRKGRPVSTEELLRDWERVKKKLGRRPSRAEYVREGKYSAGSFVGRFGSWSAVGNSSHHGDTEAQRKSGKKIARNAKSAKESKLKTIHHRGHREAQREPARESSRGLEGDKAIAFEWARSLAAIPAPLEGKRRVTEAVAAMIVNTLLPTPASATSAPVGANGNWQLAISQNQNRSTTEDTEHHLFPPFACPSKPKSGSLGAPQRARKEWGTQAVPAFGRLRKDRPVMGPPFSRHPLTNAPVNEMGVVFLFALMAWDLGFQVESLWTRGEPDGRAKRLVAPGKWQDVRIEFEYESKNFLRHGHDPKKCDVIVCWIHNWKECPEEIEVIELSRIFRM
jgi:hypothetical protein